MTTTAKTAKQLADERKPDTFDYNGATFTVPDRALLGDGELTGLLLTYPVHQACDILFCKGNIVPVGRDQLPHRELTADIYAVLRLLYPNGAWRGVLAKLRGDDGRVPIDLIPAFVNCAIEAMNPNS